MVRPNFRGVGRSTGTHDHGAGEAGDLLALCEHLRALRQELPLGLVGFSFGAFVQARVARQPLNGGSLCIATPVGNADQELRTAAQEFGSSPRPWGTPSCGCSLQVRQRFIPTPVGNAPAGRVASNDRAVHRHARGERRSENGWMDVMDGSSPRPWGTPCRWEPGCRWRRFIPTPVGNAPSMPRSLRPGSVHPHARGERAPVQSALQVPGGSSPRPWRTRVRRRAVHLLGRFIPTPVGNASHAPAFAAPAPVHPHARGERAGRIGERHHPGGSSPRPWGTLGHGRAHLGRARFIPTPVGNATPMARSLRAPTVHPHARGERALCRMKACTATGSSPRPWGTRRRFGSASRGRRFIPTPVGNAPSHSRAPGLPAVHPHARGER